MLVLKKIRWLRLANLQVLWTFRWTLLSMPYRSCLKMGRSRYPAIIRYFVLLNINFLNKEKEMCLHILVHISSKETERMKLVGVLEVLLQAMKYA